MVTRDDTEYLLRPKCVTVMARDGIEPPTPAFSGPPSNGTKWSGISEYDETISVVPPSI
jgi:hypothetical protein